MSQQAPGSGSTSPEAPDTAEGHESEEDTAASAGGEDRADGGSEGAGTSAQSTMEQTRDVADRARRESAEVADTTRREARQVADEAEAQVRGTVSEVTDKLHQQADHQTARAAEGLRRTGQGLEALADGRPEDAQQLSGYARRTASEVDRVADRVDALGFDGLVEEVQRFARRRPGAFLAGMGAAGFVVGRLGRNRSSEEAG